jgi:cytidylate kinase
MVPAEDALVIDSTHLSATQVYEQVIVLVEQKLGK